MYWKKTCKAGNVIDVHKVFSPTYGKRFTRGEVAQKTPPAMANYNDKISKRELAKVMNANFTPQDSHLVFGYFEGQRPGPEEGADQFEKARRKMRDKMRVCSEKLKYVWATAVGERGAVHHHMVANVRDLVVLQDAWPYGPVHMTKLYDDGDYSRLAKYFCGQEKGEPGGKIIIFGDKWHCSKFLERPPTKREKVKASSWREPPTAKKGYMLDPDSIDMGVNPITAAPYLFYRQVKIPQARTPMRQKVVAEMVEKNAQKMQKLWDEKLRHIKLQKVACEQDKLPKTGTTKKTTKQTTKSTTQVVPQVVEKQPARRKGDV